MFESSSSFVLGRFWIAKPSSTRVSWLAVHCFAGFIRKLIRITAFQSSSPVTFGSFVRRIRFRLAFLARSPEVILHARHAVLMFTTSVLVCALPLSLLFDHPEMIEPIKGEDASEIEQK
jgi:hypothetical protein